MKKRLLALLLALVMVLSLVPAVGASTSNVFTDADQIEADYLRAVSAMLAFNIMEGRAGGILAPQGMVTRAEMAALTHRMVTGDFLGAATGPGHSQFPDAVDHWARNYINWAAATGVIFGHPDGTFTPDRHVTLAEASVMLLRAVGYGRAEEFQGEGWNWRAWDWGTARGLYEIVNDVMNLPLELDAHINRETASQLIYNAMGITRVTFRAVINEYVPVEPVMDSTFGLLNWNYLTHLDADAVAVLFETMPGDNVPPAGTLGYVDVVNPGVDLTGFPFDGGQVTYYFPQMSPSLLGRVGNVFVTVQDDGETPSDEVAYVMVLSQDVAVAANTTWPQLRAALSLPATGFAGPRVASIERYVNFSADTTLIGWDLAGPLVANDPRMTADDVNLMRFLPVVYVTFGDTATVISAVYNTTTIETITSAAGVATANIGDNLGGVENNVPWSRIVNNTTLNLTTPGAVPGFVGDNWAEVSRTWIGGTVQNIRYTLNPVQRVTTNIARVWNDWSVEAAGVPTIPSNAIPPAVAASGPRALGFPMLDPNPEFTGQNSNVLANAHWTTSVPVGGSATSNWENLIRAAQFLITQQGVANLNNITPAQLLAANNFIAAANAGVSPNFTLTDFTRQYEFFINRLTNEVVTVRPVRAIGEAGLFYYIGSYISGDQVVSQVVRAGTATIMEVQLTGTLPAGPGAIWLTAGAGNTWNITAVPGTVAGHDGVWDPTNAAAVPAPVGVALPPIVHLPDLQITAGWATAPALAVPNPLTDVLVPAENARDAEVRPETLFTFVTLPGTANADFSTTAPSIGTRAPSYLSYVVGWDPVAEVHWITHVIAVRPTPL